MARPFIAPHDGMTAAEFDALVRREFARCLKEARVAAGFRSATAFARTLGIEAARYRHWERGHALPDIEFLAVRLCPALRVSPDDLLPMNQRTWWASKSGPEPVRRDCLEIDETAPPTQRGAGVPVMWRRLLVLLGLSRPKPPAPDMTNVVDLQQERWKRTPIILPGFMTERDVREQRRGDDRRLRLVRARE